MHFSQLKNGIGSFLQKINQLYNSDLNYKRSFRAYI